MTKFIRNKLLLIIIKITNIFILNRMENVLNAITPNLFIYNLVSVHNMDDY